uniref:Uncharacterized protein n=1 Tax=Opuntia streptacantha TaxID=393608 RepID=A0A7C8ZX82_OPUST
MFACIDRKSEDIEPCEQSFCLKIYKLLNKVFEIKLLLVFPCSGEHEDLSAKAKSRFIAALRSLSQPMSLKEIARTWDDCTRAVISDYAQQNSGGTFSSKYGAWENCLSTV